MQILRRQFFIEQSSTDVEIVASGYATDAHGIVDCTVSKNGHVTHRSCLNSDIEETDLRIIPRFRRSQGGIMIV